MTDAHLLHVRQAQLAGSPRKHEALSGCPARRASELRCVKPPPVSSECNATPPSTVSHSQLVKTASAPSADCSSTAPELKARPGQFLACCLTASLPSLPRRPGHRKLLCRGAPAPANGGATRQGLPGSNGDLTQVRVRPHLDRLG